MQKALHLIKEGMQGRNRGLLGPVRDHDIPALLDLYPLEGRIVHTSHVNTARAGETLYRAAKWRARS
jgi:hypothetical protein